MGSTSGRFFGWVIGGTLPVALAADWLTAAWDQNGASSASSPAAAVVEEICGGWLKELLGLPPTVSFAFVTDRKSTRLNSSHLGISYAVFCLKKKKKKK